MKPDAVQTPPANINTLSQLLVDSYIKPEIHIQDLLQQHRWIFTKEDWNTLS